MCVMYIHFFKAVSTQVYLIEVFFKSGFVCVDADPVPGAIQKTVGNVQDGKFEYGPGNFEENFLTPLFFYCRLKGFIYEFLLIIYCHFY